MIGMTEHQLKNGLLWWRNSIYKELFDKAITIQLTIGLEESLIRLKNRAMNDKNISKEIKKSEGTLLALEFINNLVYSPEGKKMTRNDKKAFIRKTQESIISTYITTFAHESTKHITISGESSISELEKQLQKQVVDTIV